MSFVLSTLDNANLQSYDGLVASIQSRMDRTDIAADIPDFIYLCERELERRLRTPFRETSTAITLAATVDLPEDCKAVRVVSTARGALRQCSLASIRDMLETSGTPVCYAVVADVLIIGPPPAGSETATLVYEQIITPLSETTPSNWLLDRHADAYFFGSLMQGFAHVGDEQRAITYRAMFTEVIDQINDEGIRMAHSGGPLRPIAVVTE